MHLIRRQILELELPREQGAAQLAQRAALLLQEKVLPQLDELFSRLAPLGRVLRIPSLEIDLARLPETRFEEHFVALCVKQIAEQVEALSLAAAVGTAEADVQQLGAADQAREVLFYFLAHGLMPWYAAHWSLAELEEKTAAWVQTPDAAGAQRLRQLAARQPQALRRISWQLSWPSAAALLELALDLVPGRLAQNLAIWPTQSAVAHAPVSPAIQRRLLEVVASVADLHVFREQPDATRLLHWLQRHGLLGATGASEAASVQAVSPAESRQASPQATPPDAHQSGRQVDQPTSAANAASDAALEANASNPIAKAHAKLPTSEPGQVQAQQPAQALDGPEPPQKPAKGEAEGTKSQKTDINSGASLPASGPGQATSSGLPTPDDRFWVQYAGLVLLAPYLPALLDHLGYLKASGPEAKYRAAHLLYYLATAASEPDESQLGLIKLLSGLAWDEAVPKEISLSPEEKEEAEALLLAVIRNWPILKNTSPEGLRTGFLQRPGLLSWSEGRQAWLLQVERQGMDILLDQLPWGFSVIKHPWMGQMLMVEW